MKKILIVDDISTNRKLMAAILGDTGWKCLQAENGKQALKQVLNEKPDLIITDLDMPEMGGHEFIKKLRENKETSNIPVLVYTAANYIPDASVLCKTYGVPLVLIKPCDNEIILSSIQKVMTLVEEEEKSEKKDVPKQLLVYVSDLDNLKVAIDALKNHTELLSKENLQILLSAVYNPKKN